MQKEFLQLVEICEEVTNDMDDHRVSGRTPAAEHNRHQWRRVPRQSREVFGRTPMDNFFTLFWGWADHDRKDWSTAPYKNANASSGGLAKFFASFWGWADYTIKDWPSARYKPEQSARRVSSIRYRSG